MDEKITRRRALGVLGTVSLGTLLAACRGATKAVTRTSVSTSAGATASVEPQTPSDSLANAFDDAASCSLAPEETEGPYYFDVDSIRSDIREDREGTPLGLGVRVRDAAACTAIADAVVDIWHCDADGIYSGFESASQGGPGGGGGPTDDDTFLRGAQVTNADGIVQFRTVYPGWYRGRTVHIHTKVHLNGSEVLTTQLFFDEGITDAVYTAEPYASNGGRDTFNDTDGIFDQRLILTLSEEGDGYLGVITLGVDRS